MLHTNLKIFLVIPNAIKSKLLNQKMINRKFKYNQSILMFYHQKIANMIGIMRIKDLHGIVNVIKVVNKVQLIYQLKASAQ